MGTVNVTTTAEDGYINDFATTLTVVKTDPDVFISASSMTGASTPTIGEYNRGFWFFPAPSIPAGAVVTRVRFHYVVGSVFDALDGDLYLYVSNRADLGTTLDAGDYGAIVGAEDGINIFRVYADITPGGTLPGSGAHAIDLPVASLNLSGTTNVEMVYFMLSEGGSSASFLDIWAVEHGSLAAFLEIDYWQPSPRRGLLPIVGSWIGPAIQVKRAMRMAAFEGQPIPRALRMPTPWTAASVPTPTRRWVQPPDLIPAPRRWLQAMRSWSALAPQQAQPSRKVDPSPSLLSPRRWLSGLAGWWKTVDPSRRRPGLPVPATEEPPPPPPPPETPPPDICFPKIAAPTTAFSRSAAPATAFSRIPVGSYDDGVLTRTAFQRESVATLAATRYTRLDPAFNRLDDPHCAHAPEPPAPIPSGLGYGDLYGENYGGGV